MFLKQDAVVWDRDRRAQIVRGIFDEVFKDGAPFALQEEFDTPSLCFVLQMALIVILRTMVVTSPGRF